MKRSRWEGWERRNSGPSDQKKEIITRKSIEKEIFWVKHGKGRGGRGLRTDRKEGALLNVGQNLFISANTLSIDTNLVGLRIDGSHVCGGLAIKFLPPRSVRTPSHVLLLIGVMRITSHFVRKCGMLNERMNGRQRRGSEEFQKGAKIF